MRLGYKEKKEKRVNNVPQGGKKHRYAKESRVPHKQQEQLSLHERDVKGKDTRPLPFHSSRLPLHYPYRKIKSNAAPYAKWSESNNPCSAIRE